jgi:hypothetical protein
MKIGDVIQQIIDVYPNFKKTLNPTFATAMEAIALAVIIAFVAIFIWYFYKSLSRRNLIGLNLLQYNKTKHPFLRKFLAVVLYFVEYILIMPALIALWFGALSFILMAIGDNASLNQILLISAAMVAAVRILAYYHSEISRDLAKMFPFVALSLLLLSPSELDVTRMLNQIKELPFMFNNVASFLIAILGVEILFRVLFTIIDFIASEKEK